MRLPEHGYQALSYTWGPPKPTAPIICNGQVLNVTMNLYEALLYLRHRGVRRIWIDAICINQQDLKERGEQVKLMQLIYQQATSLIIWLGAGSESSDEGFRLIDHLRCQVSDLYERTDFDANLLSTCSEEGLDGLAELLCRPWFSRVWIIQEVLAGKNRAMVYCGKKGRIWSHFMHGIMTLAQRGLLNALAKNQNQVSSNLQQLQLFEVFEHGKFDLLALASLARSAQATDARDKIFALLNLATDFKGQSPTIQSFDESPRSHLTEEPVEPFLIDYGQSVRRTYIYAAKAMILSSGFDSVLSQIRGNNLSISLPSWVPDWSVPIKGCPIGRRVWYPENEPSMHGYRPRTQSKCVIEKARCNQKTFDASQSHGQPIFNDDDSLCLTGIRFDIIKRMTEVYPGGSNSGGDISNWLKQFDKLAERCSPDIATGSTEEALWRTLIIDTSNDVQPAPSAFKQSYLDFRHIAEFSLPLQVNSNDDVPRTTSIYNYSIPFLRVMAPWIATRRFATTGNEYIGLVPDTTLIGDTVAIIRGCSVPVVLPTVEEGFHLVGDCYIHGTMYGEAVTLTPMLRNKKHIHRRQAQQSWERFLLK
ncbi:hypothetical protein BP6252_13119 [Coleophoma cylindrospora]|uniref:Heterokaryon incompatibility domain-containing protein n=1 Tax=Coleophoma cylindrospora TaxID=1849047 RepID=A0A3D8Q9X6_9HELO|nr:hypothetical protein BP6252_13119 [Coleophoma cylindrospora]